MDGATDNRRAGALSSFLAGLQAGMLGILAMLAWLGISAAWQQRSFWTSENLMASVFWGRDAIHSGFAGRTVSGLAIYLLLYSLLGGLLGLVLRDKLARMRVLLISLAFAMAWYYLSYRVLWKSLAPLVSLLHVERATVLGHLVYGTILGRYPVYLEKPPAPVVAEKIAAEKIDAEKVPAEAAPPVETAPPVPLPAALSPEMPAEPGPGSEPAIDSEPR
jgi:hypothetical protein